MKEITKEKLIEQLETKNKRETARYFNVCPQTIAKKIKKYNITIKKITNRDDSVIGKTYNMLTVVSFHSIGKGYKSFYLCECQCGNKCIINKWSMLRGLTQSCGCLKTSKLRCKGYNDISYTRFKRLHEEADRRKIYIDIKIEDIWNQYIKQNKLCYFSKIPIVFHPDSNKEVAQTASIDRLDNSKGYTKDNIVIVHKRVNIMKGNMTEQEFSYWVHKLSDNMIRVNYISNHQMFVHNKNTYEIN